MSAGRNFPLSFVIGKDLNKNPPEWLDVIMEVRGNTILVKGSGTVFAGTKTTEKELGRFEYPLGNFPTGKIGFRVDGGEEFEITSPIIAPGS